MGILDVEAAGLGIREEAFDAPATPIEMQGTPGVLHIGRDDEALLSPDPLCRELEPVFGLSAMGCSQPVQLRLLPLRLLCTSVRNSLSIPSSLVRTCRFSRKRTMNGTLF